MPAVKREGQKPFFPEVRKDFIKKTLRRDMIAIVDFEDEDTDPEKLKKRVFTAILKELHVTPIIDHFDVMVSDDGDGRSGKIAVGVYRPGRGRNLRTPPLDY